MLSIFKLMRIVVILAMLVLTTIAVLNEMYLHACFFICYALFLYLTRKEAQRYLESLFGQGIEDEEDEKF